VNSRNDYVKMTAP